MAEPANPGDQSSENSGGRPVIGIIVTYYNDELWLADCLRSLQAQSYPHWEAVIVDDHSIVDQVGTIVSEINDPRIRHLRHPVNRGPAAARNTGFRQLSNVWILCIDGDDEILPDTLEVMLARAMEPDRPDCVICDYELFGSETGFREHPVRPLAMLRETQWVPGAGVMISRALWLAAGGYSEDPVFSLGNEDWDFWIAAARNGFAAARVPEPLYRYRQRSASLSRRLLTSDHLTREAILRRHSSFFDDASAAAFLAEGYWRASHASASQGRLFRTLRLATIANSRSPRGDQWRDHVRVALRSFLRRSAALVPGLLMVKRSLAASFRRVLGGAATALGRAAGHAYALKPGNRRASPVFLFFPWDELGGADLVHLSICEALQPRRPLVVFDLVPAQTVLAARFNRSADVWRLGRWLRRSRTAPLAHGFLAGYIASHNEPCVFGGNSETFYQIVPLLPARILCIDLLHAVGGGYVERSLAVAQRLQSRIVISPEIRDALASQYRLASLPEALTERIQLIPNSCMVPVAGERRPGSGALRILFVGRDAPEKRLDLVASIGVLAQQRLSPSPELTAVGRIDPSRLPGFRCLGQFTDARDLSRVYLEHDVLLLPSEREGFPLVVTEAMMHGVIPLCTAVGGLPAALRDGEDSFLVPLGASGPELVESFVRCLEILNSDPGLRASMSQNARTRSAAWGSPEAFSRAYRHLLIHES